MAASAAQGFSPCPERLVPAAQVAAKIHLERTTVVRVVLQVRRGMVDDDRPSAGWAMPVDSGTVGGAAAPYPGSASPRALFRRLGGAAKRPHVLINVFVRVCVESRYVMYCATVFIEWRRICELLCRLKYFEVETRRHKKAPLLSFIKLHVSAPKAKRLTKVETREALR